MIIFFSYMKVTPKIYFSLKHFPPIKKTYTIIYMKYVGFEITAKKINIFQRLYFLDDGKARDLKCYNISCPLY